MRDIGFVLIGGRLSVDFCNLPSLPATGSSKTLSWEELVGFLRASRIISPERSHELLALTESDPQAAFDLLNRAQRLRDALRFCFHALATKDHVSRESIAPINEVLRVTEGHDELVGSGRSWKIEFLAREDSLDWLLAAIARSAAELLTERETPCIRLCANPACTLF